MVVILTLNYLSAPSVERVTDIRELLLTKKKIEKGPKFAQNGENLQLYLFRRRHTHSHAIMNSTNEFAIQFPRPAITAVAIQQVSECNAKIASQIGVVGGRRASRGPKTRTTTTTIEKIATTSEVTVQPVGSAIKEYCSQQFTMSEKELRNTIRRLRDDDPTLTKLDLRDVNGSRSYVFEGGSNECIFQEMIEALSMNTTVQSVSIVLRFLHNLSMEENVVMFRAIGSLPNLKELRIASMGFTCLALRLVNEILEVVGSNPVDEQRLEILTLHSMQYRGQSYYNNTANNTHPRLNTHTRDFQNFLSALQQLKKLKAFTLKDAQMTFDLNKLILNGLASMPSLTKIEINSHEFPNEPRLSETSLTAVATSLPNLKLLSLRRLHLGPIIPHFLSGLIYHPTLECLTLEQNLMGAECATVLSNLLEHNAVLKELYLAYNMIPDSIGALIAEALARNRESNIAELDLAANEIGNSSCQAFARVLESSTSKLEHLNLSQHTLPVEGIERLATGLQSNNKLKSLTLMEVQMNEESGIVIASALKHNTALERLNVSDNRLGNRTCVEFGRLLKTNKTIKSINFCSNRISNPGAILLADALLVNDALEQVNLVNNYSIGTVAYDVFEVMIQENMTLKHLWLPTTLPKSNIPSFVRLNRLGRRDLLQEMENPSKWLHAINKCKDDHIASYYLVRANPNVVSWMRR